MYRIAPGVIALVTVAACASPNPPTVSTADVQRAYAEANYISGLPFTATDDLPTGSTTYRGQLGADVSGDYRGSMLGDMTMNVDFADNDVRGSVTNINLIDSDGRPDQQLSGSLGIGNGPRSIVVSGIYAYVVDNGSDDLKVIDVSNPTTLILSGSIGIRNRRISDAYAATEDWGGRVTDINHLQVIRTTIHYIGIIARYNDRSRIT